TANMVTFSLDASRNGYKAARIDETYQAVQERLKTVPGVQSAALSDIALLSGDNSTSSIHVDGYQPKPEEDMNPHFMQLSPGYFATLGTPLLLGRDVTIADRLR